MHILEFFLLRDRLGTGNGDPEALLARMETLVYEEIAVSRRLAKISTADCRLGYHSECEAFRYFPEKLEDRAAYLETLLKTEFPAVRQRIVQGLPPLEYYEGIDPGARRYTLDSGWDNMDSGLAQVCIAENGHDLTIRFRSTQRETLTVVPEFRLFTFDPAMEIAADGTISVSGESAIYSGMLPDACAAEVCKYSAKVLPCSAEFPGTNLEVRLDKRRFQCSDRPMKLSLKGTKSGFWNQPTDPKRYLGKCNLPAESFVWLDRNK